MRKEKRSASVSLAVVGVPPNTSLPKERRELRPETPRTFAFPNHSPDIYLKIDQRGGVTSNTPVTPFVRFLNVFSGIEVESLYF
jgi:hypothetical protein